MGEGMMEQRIVKGTDLMVTRLCIGSITFSAQADEATVALKVNLCLDHGINFFDTTN